MRLAVVIPYSTNYSSSHPLNSPSWSILNKRRGSMGGILSTSVPASPTGTHGGLMILGRRRTVFGDGRESGGWWCPEALVSACESVSEVVSVQSTLRPLPTHRPLVILVPIQFNALGDGSSSMAVDSTPSAVCFPSPAVDPLPPLSPLDRALAHLRRAKRELEELAADLEEIVLMAYAVNPEHTDAALANGAKGVLTPPYTPDAVLSSFASALDVQPEQLSISLSLPPPSSTTTKSRFGRRLRTASSSSSSTSPSTPKVRRESTFAALSSYVLPNLRSSSSKSVSSASASSPPQPTPYTDSPTTPKQQWEAKPLPPIPTFAPLHIPGMNASPVAGSPIEGSPPKRTTPTRERVWGRALPRIEEPIRGSMESVRPVIQTTPLPPREPYPSNSIAPLSPPPSATQSSESLPQPPHVDFEVPRLEGERRKSVDMGGLALALALDEASLEEEGGWGWAGWEMAGGVSEGPLYAELLSDMYVHTRNVTDAALISSSPPTSPSSSSPPSRTSLISLLTKWDFNPHTLPPSSLLASATLIFEALFRLPAIHSDPSIPPFEAFPPFLRSVRAMYHERNGYHNFEHAVDVLQGVYCFLVQAGCVPPLGILGEEEEWTMPLGEKGRVERDSKGMWTPKGKKKGVVECLEGRDLLALCVAAIGHDVGHPGLSNAFMKNARAPLSVVYDDKSALEQMHCALLLKLMRKHGLASLVDTHSPFRKTLVETVLATDMSVHFDWMRRLGELAQGGVGMSKEEKKTLLCQALIKCGDISNPTRPHAVSEHWSSALLEEWSCQAMLERELGLPVSVVASADEVVQAKGQVGFIDMFTKPLFDTTAAVIPAFAVFARQGDANRAQWQKRLEVCLASESPRIITPSAAVLSQAHDQHYRAVFPLSLPPSLIPPSSLPTDDSPESGTPTKSPPPPPRHSSVSSTSSIVVSPFAAGETSTAASSPASHSRSIDQMYPAATPQSPPPTRVRTAFNAGMRRRKSAHRLSWDSQRGPPPSVPPLPSPSMLPQPPPSPQK